MKKYSLSAVCVVALISMQFGAFAQKEKHVTKQISPNNENYGAVPNENGVIRCASMEADATLRSKYPTMPTLEQEEAILQQQIIEYKAAQASNGSAAKATLLTIPIIFHVFTDGVGAENISANVVQYQIDQMNIDYRNLAGSGSGVAADIEIEFCLALVDPNGVTLTEPGIERITSYGDGPFSSTSFDNTMKAATFWNPDNYFNVWVADLSGGLLGYAQFPSNSTLAGFSANEGPATTDGVVILYSSMGSTANPFPGGAPYNRGRTLTHESGHWLGLRHIWGDSNCGNDFCSDTPQSTTSNFGCPNQTTCDGNADMVENYMDYTDDNCMDVFTADQKIRIRTVMTVGTRRMTLPASTACGVVILDPDDVGVSDITSPVGSSCSGGFTPVIVVTNYGANAVSAFTVFYNIDGAGTQSYPWTGNLAVGASTTVTLPYISSGGTHTFNAYTNLPNGNTDSNSGNDADASSYTLTAGGQVVTFNLSTDCWGEEVYWELKDAGSNVIFTGGNTGVTIMPGGLQTGTTQGDQGAYPSDATTAEDWCLALGCYTFTIYDDWGDGMNGSTEPNCSVDGNYSITDQWGNAYVTMQNVNYGNSETSNFCVVVGLDELANNNVNVYPNPSEGLFNVELKNFNGEEHTVTVSDIAGRIVMNTTVGEGAFQLDLSNTAGGSYMVTIESATSKMMKRIVVRN